MPIHRLISIYKVAERPNGSRRAITLPRLSLSFPTISLRVTIDLIISSEEKTPHEWFYSCNALPYLLEENGKHWKEHLDMQLELSRRFNEGKPLKNTDPGRFARFALKTSRYTRQAKEKLLTDMEDALAFSTTGKKGKTEYRKWLKLKYKPEPELPSPKLGDEAEERKKTEEEAKAGSSGVPPSKKQ